MHYSDVNSCPRLVIQLSINPYYPSAPTSQYVGANIAITLSRCVWVCVYICLSRFIGVYANTIKGKPLI